INEYGPTETAVGCCVYEVGAEDEQSGAVAIGRAIANTQLYLLDEAGELVARGMSGELYIGGAGVARGYYQRSELTAERFVPDAYSGAVGGRLYRSGDRGRYREDGEIEYLGRQDEQVKVRGYRIELGEIESVLGEAAGVQQAVVVLREAEPQGESAGESWVDQRIVAYVVVESGAAGEAEVVKRLRAHLSQKLPEYMMPSAIVLLAELPLTANGKVDRRALPEALPSGLTASGLAAARSPLEEILVGIWRDVLRVERVGVHDNFFELGGHSLLATQMLSRVRESFHVEVPLRSFFDSPTLTELAGNIERQTKNGRAEVWSSPIKAVERNGELPLSFAQQRLWFLNHLEGESAVYNIPTAVRLTGQLNISALEQALTEIVRRHETLRATFPLRDGRPVQTIAPANPVAVSLIDLRPLLETEREIKAKQLIRDEAQRPFQLANGPLLHASLLQLADDEYIALLTMHHIASDGWSMNVLIRELTTLYVAFLEGKPSPLPELPIQYADFAHWQREWLQGEVLEKQLAYWKQQLADLPVLELPSDRPRPAVQTFNGAQYSFVIDENLTGSLKRLSGNQSTTLFMTLMAAFKVLLHRYTGQERISIGTPIAGRNRAEIESLIGFFANTLVLSTDLSGNPNVRELLRREREVALGAYTNQDVPFEKLVSELQPERDLSHTPLFQVMMVWQNIPRETLELSGLQLSAPGGAASATAKFDLTLVMEEVEQELRGSVQYNTDLFDATTIRRMIEHFKNVLAAMTSVPEQRLAFLPLLTPADQHQLLREWNDTAREYPPHCLHELFEAQVERTPDAVAVIFEKQQLGYGELNRRANQLAHYLRGIGVGPEVLVGVLMERSLEMLVALLGILKAGAAYLPLDADYPGERLSFMLADAQAPVLLTQAGLLERVPASTAQVLCVDRDWPAISIESEENARTAVTAENLVYVIYTSGSTGQPKGAMLSHRGIVNCLSWMQATYQLGAADRFLHKASLGFDPSVWELFWPLMTGAGIVMAPPRAQLDSAALLETIIRQQVSLAYFVPSALKLFLAERGVEQAASLRQVICGGESLAPETMAQFFQLLPAELHHSYGPTETSIAVSEWVCERGGERVLIGKPLANTQVYVLDRRGEPVPLGAAGELYVGGAGVGRGYLGRSELTGERFIPDQFSGAMGARLYRTGDRVRYVAEGHLEFLGRVDEQVKIRGYRIELGEIEAVLTQHPAVQETVVMARSDESESRKILVAYVVSKEGTAPATEELRRYLQEKLPDYMIPTVFVLMDQLPLLANGKVDRRALPALEQARASLARAYRPPRTWAEEVLVNIWQEVLNIERIGVTENFFELGGDSILSIQIVAHANQAGVRLTTRHLFQHQTIAELALVAGTAAVVEADQEIVTGPVPLTPIQHGFFSRELVEPHRYNHALMLEARQPLDATQLRNVVRQVLIHHDALRMRFVRDDQEWHQYNAGAEDHLPFRVIDLSTVAENEQKAAIEAEAGRVETSLNLADGPMLRVVLFELGANRPQRLLIVSHHLVIDGVSWRILLEDLQAAYAQASEEQEIKLPPKTTSFKRWAEALQAHARSDELRQELGYWTDEARRRVKCVPVDHPGGGNYVADASRVSVSLSSRETRALLRQVPMAYHTQINDVLLAALAKTVSSWSHSNVVLVELEGHGREDIIEAVDLTRTIGWFTAAYPLLLEIEPMAEPRQTLQAVKEQLQGVPRRGVGYGLLRYLSGDREVEKQLQTLPPAEISFNYLGKLDQVLGNDAPFTPAKESIGASQSPVAIRTHLLEINGHIANGQLRLIWNYSKQVHDVATIEKLAANYLSELRLWIANCGSISHGVYLPSDFPLVQLEQDELDGLTRVAKDIEDIYPLSPMQQGMLFHSLYAPNSGVYVNNFSWTVQGAFDVKAFERAWQKVVERHAVLRTSFVWEGVAEPVQMVHGRVQLTVEQEDWRGLSDAEQNERLAAVRQMEQARGFDLSAAPLMRVTLIRTEEDRYEVAWTQHHLLLDGWCFSLILKELFLYYEAYCLGQDLDLARPHPYRDYIVWLQKQDLRKAETYWRATLAGFATPTPLPRARLAGKLKDAAEDFGQHQERLSEALTARLRSFARQHQVTLSTFMQGAWAILLSCYSGERDVLFGATVAGRPTELAGVEDMIGLLINTLPVRVQVRADQSLKDWLQELQQLGGEMRQYEYSPLVKVQEWSEVRQGVPLFESLLVFENYPVDATLAERARQNQNIRIAGVTALEKTNYPLHLVLGGAGQQISLRANYDRRRFTQAAIEQMMICFKTLLQNIVSAPEQCPAALSLLTDSEQQQLLVDWNDTAQEFAGSKRLHELFEAQVERCAEAVAVVFEE
ncbi:MAG: amino acid adenylation domain-containing protein, partial [Acidobacteriota bacterium]